MIIFFFRRNWEKKLNVTCAKHIALRDVERCNTSEIVETKISWSKRDKWTRFSNERSGIALETRNDETIVVPKESAATRKQRGWRERFNFSVIARQVWRVPDSTLSTRRPRSIRSRVGPRPSKPTFRGVAIFLRMFPHTLPSFHPLFSPSDFFPLPLSLFLPPLLINLRISVYKRFRSRTNTRVDINRAWQLSRFDYYAIHRLYYRVRELAFIR